MRAQPRNRISRNPPHRSQHPERRPGADEILHLAPAVSGLATAGHRHGGSGGEVAGNGVSVGQLGMERANYRRFVPVSMRHRSVLQRDQADLQLADFLGHNANAVRWQIWTALLTYLLPRFCAWVSRRGHSFIRLFTLLRSALWLRLQLRSLLESYGTAGGSFRFLGNPQQAHLPGLL